jgi:hypothetical protein
MADTKDAACTKYLVQGIRHGNACEAYGKFENTTKMKERIQGGSLLLKKRNVYELFGGSPLPPGEKKKRKFCATSFKESTSSKSYHLLPGVQKFRLCITLHHEFGS